MLLTNSYRKMTRLYDNHNHSQFSFDGKKASVESSARAAVSAGLAGLCFTDHCDFYVPPMKASHEHLVPEQFDIAAQQAEIDRVRCLIPEIEIFKGIEIGLEERSRESIRKLLAENEFDEVLASVHYLDDTDPFWGGYYQGKDWKTAYGHYLETIYREMTWLTDFDIIGHFDYVARYAPYPECSIFYRDFPDIFDSILGYLADNGKALEINTKTYQDYSGRTPVLDKDILLRFRELGGEAVSLGSDSHFPERVGDEFRLYSEFIKACGFKYTAHFSRRKLILGTI